jgi:hypothetical protein
MSWLYVNDVHDKSTANVCTISGSCFIWIVQCWDVWMLCCAVLSVAVGLGISALGMSATLLSVSQLVSSAFSGIVSCDQHLRPCICLKTELCQDFHNLHL